jgi:NAD(P)-dependent dehydrogenase (short-subunit alcohol dehydrogenase family)
MKELICFTEKIASIDLFVANAGILGGIGIDLSEEVWMRSININFMQ